MTTLLDVTVQHTGWRDGTFAGGGWHDWFALSATGATARSYYAQSLNSAFLDQAAAFAASPETSEFPLWFNLHVNTPHQGPTVPSPFVTPAGMGVRTFTRVPRNSDVILWRLVVSDQGTTPPPTRPPCEYGTVAKSGFPTGVIITQSLIDAVLAAAGLQALSVAFGVLVGVSLGVTTLCSTQPPPMPALDPNLFANDPAKLMQAFQTVAWPYFCECAPGAPAPVPFPPPSFTPPVGWPAPPSFSCDPADICASLVRLEALLNQVNGTVANAYNLTAVIQRWGVPFAVVPGAMHQGLTGSGDFSVPQLIGIQYEVVTKPPDFRAYLGVPNYIRDLGWVGFITSSGATAEHRVTRDAELWLPSESRLSNRFGWALTEGTEINVRELYAET